MTWKHSWWVCCLTLLLLGTAPLASQSRADDPKADDDSPVDLSDYFVLVPFPCPGLKEYAKAQAFVDQICQGADAAHIKVILVRACYDRASDGLRPGWWEDQINDLPHHYAKYVTDGTVKIVDEYPDLPLQFTPSGFFYRKGKVEWKGQLNADDPKTVLTSLGIAAPAAPASAPTSPSNSAK